MSESHLDSISRSVKVIDVGHHEIHEGDHYFIKEVRALGIGASFQYVFVTPDTLARCHITIAASNSIEASYELKEGIATSADGTSVTPVNRDRNSTNTTVLTVTHTPTSPTGGAVLGAASFGQNRSYGGSARDEHELILKQNTKYLFTVTNDGSGSNNISFAFDWYDLEAS